VINFYEPLAGLYYAWYRPAVPLVAIAHQYMFLHPWYPFPRRFCLQRQATTWFTRMTAAGATRKLALSLYEAPDRASERLCVVPPLLRDELFTQPLDVCEPFFLIYLYDQGFAEALLRWHQTHPEVALHCFWDNPAAEEREAYDATLTFHRLHDERFLSMMARCRGVISTAGFESMTEAMYLGKPLLLVPIRHHFEQLCNALDGRNAGAGVVAHDFAIDRLVDYLPTHQPKTARFRAWVARAEARFIGEIEQVGRHPRQAAGVAVPCGQVTSCRQSLALGSPRVRLGVP